MINDELDKEQPIGRKATKKSKRILWTIFIIIVIIAYPWFYIGLPIQGRVVDATTGEPLQGVIVLANWQLHAGLLVDNQIGQIYLAEAVTDSTGKYRFPFWIRAPLRGSIESSSPVLYFYKKDYRVTSEGNWKQRHAPIIFSSSKADGKTIKLAPFEGQLQEYAEHIDNTIKSRISRMDNSDCILTKTPIIIQAMKDEQVIFNQAGIRNRWSSLGIMEDVNETCSGIDGLLRRIL